MIELLVILLVAIIGVILDWLLKPRLPTNPKFRHTISGLTFIVILVIVLVWLKRFEEVPIPDKSEPLLRTLIALEEKKSHEMNRLETLQAGYIGGNTKYEATITAIAEQLIQIESTKNALDINNVLITIPTYTPMFTQPPTSMPNPGTTATITIINGSGQPISFNLESINHPGRDYEFNIPDGETTSIVVIHDIYTATVIACGVTNTWQRINAYTNSVYTFTHCG